jgi:hypothetical protein
MPMVEIEKPADEPLGDWFEALRGWLDRNGCAGMTFARVGQGSERLVYRLAFGDAALAEKFSHTFAVYLTEKSETLSDDIPKFIAVDGPGNAPA